MRVVLDTNCLISCVGKRSAYRAVFDAFLYGRFDLCVSTEILLEYEEKFDEFWGEAVTQNLLAVLLTSENTSLHSVYFNFCLVKGDEDDNKFVDVYIAGSADILVSNDRKVLAVEKDSFPKVRTMTLQDFHALLTEQS